MLQRRKEKLTELLANLFHTLLFFPELVLRFSYAAELTNVDGFSRCLR